MMFSFGSWGAATIQGGTDNFWCAVLSAMSWPRNASPCRHRKASPMSARRLRLACERISDMPLAVLSYRSDTVFEESEDTGWREVSIVPAAAPRPETQEEILAAVLAARDERDIPAEDDSWVIVDSDGDRPAELAGLDGVELDELLACASACPSGQAGLDGVELDELLACASACPSGLDGAELDGLLAAVSGQPSRPSGASGQAGLAELGELAAAAPAGPCGSAAAGPVTEGGSSGLVAGFAEGGVLDVLAPGVALAGFAEDAHAGLAGLTDDELIGVLRAWRRQVSWAQARELATVAELARRRPADGTPPARPGFLPANVSEFTADEVGLALTLTRRSAGAQLDLALALIGRPDTAALLEAGEIDLPKVRVIIDGIAGLTEAHAAAVEAAVLPEAPAITSGQLRAAVARAVLAADPDAARRDREERLKDARVECWADPTGTANLAGRDLPCAETLAADKRLCQIAWAWKKQISAAWKRAGPAGELPRPAAGTDLLRARAYLALLLGQPVGAPPADLLPGAAPAPGAPPGSPAYPGQPSPDSTEGRGPARDGTEGRGPWPDGESTAGASAPDLPPGLRGPAPGPGGSLPPLAGQVFLTLPLATLLGLSDAPGQAAAHGPVDPDTSRALARAAAGHPTAGWHLIITDPYGRAVGYGYAPRARPARARPVRARPARDQRARGHPARSQPAPGHPADGWTITLTTERIARGQSP
jgi:Domain of unknown function (DUF222)